MTSTDSKEQVVYELKRNEEGVKVVVEHSIYLMPVTESDPIQYVPCHFYEHVYPFEQDHEENKHLKFENEKLRLENENEKLRLENENEKLRLENEKSRLEVVRLKDKYEPLHIDELFDLK